MGIHNILRVTTIFGEYKKTRNVIKNERVINGSSYGYYPDEMNPREFKKQ